MGETKTEELIKVKQDRFDDIETKQTDINNKKTKNEIIEELKNIKNDIVQKEGEKEQIQNDINKAVANDEYEICGQLAPKKKKLISQLNELKIEVEKLEKELQEIMENENEN